MSGSGKIVAWGDDKYGQVTGAPRDQDFIAVAPGGAGQCLAIRLDGTLALWGGADAGKQVVPPLSGTSLPDTTSVIPGTSAPVISDRALAFPWDDIVTASLSIGHFVALRKDGAVVVWGKFSTGASAKPPPGLLARAVAANGDSCVAIRMDGSLERWGGLPTAPLGRFTKVSARGDYAIALHEDGRLFGWGNKTYFKAWKWTHEGAEHYSTEGPFADLAAGVLQKDAENTPHVLALTSEGEVKGWGPNKFGETNEQPDVRFKAIAAGLKYSVGLDHEGNIHYWGIPIGHPVRPSGGDLGSAPAELFPPPSGNFISISAGARQALAVRFLRGLPDPFRSGVPVDRVVLANQPLKRGPG